MSPVALPKIISKSVVSLVGTVPYHRCYVLLYHHQPPPEYPSKLTIPVFKTLQAMLSTRGGLANVVWRKDLNVQPNTQEVYRATAYTALGGRLELPEVSMSNVEEVVDRLVRHMNPLPKEPVHHGNETQIYVCTHAARDCRCGDGGRLVVDALHQELEARKAELESKNHRIIVGESAHIGNHKDAVNAMVYPHGDWLGSLQAGDVPALVDALVATVPGQTSKMEEFLPTNWRGRLGLDRDSAWALAFLAKQRNAGFAGTKVLAHAERAIKSSKSRKS